MDCLDHFEHEKLFGVKYTGAYLFDESVKKKLGNCIEMKAH